MFRYAGEPQAVPTRGEITYDRAGRGEAEGVEAVDRELKSDGIRVVARGEALLAPSVTRRVLDAFAESTPPVPPDRARVLNALTASELRVLTLVGRGLSNEEIARELFVADTTVRTHVRHILDKLNLRNRVQAVVLAYDTGLVQPNLR